MTLAVRSKEVKRYASILKLFRKYGRSDVFRKGGLDEVGVATAAAQPGSEVPDPEELADELERLGPTFVKLGQVLSTRADLLPMPYLEALSRLQDNVGPFPWDEAEAIVTSELGVRLSKAFSSFDRVPLAAASLGQVHRAALRDGREVVVKVQRPHIREQIVQDLDVMGRLAAVLDRYTRMGRRYGFTEVVEEFRKSLFKELDYQLEAHNLARLRRNLRDFDRIVVPAPLEAFSTSRVLTIQYVRGQKINSFSPLVLTEIDGAELTEQMFRAYLKQVLVDGFVHADPHPGNVFLTDDNRIALLDLGMVARLTPTMQERLLELLLAISEARGDEAANIALRIGHVDDERFDERMYRRRVGDLVNASESQRVERLQVGRIVLGLASMAAETGVRVPPELTLLGKTLLNLDEVARILHPRFDPTEAVRRYATQVAQERMRRSFSRSHMLSAAIEAKHFLEQFPSRANMILEKLANNELKVTVDAIDEEHLMEGFQKVANRITVGLVLAALIVSSSQLMRVETTWRLFGYPALAILLFLAAAAGGVMLMADILWSDEKSTRKRPPAVR